MFRHLGKFLDIFYMKGTANFNFCDCWGICILFNKEILGKELPSHMNSDIFSNEAIEKFVSTQKSQFKRIEYGKEMQGDVVLLNIKGYPIHTGVVINKSMMLHIMDGKRAELANYNSITWKNRVDSFWRFKG